MKRNKFMRLGLIAVLFTGMTFTSCDDVLDINYNPNFPTEGTMSTLLPSAGATTAAQFGYNGTLIGTMWLQHTTQGNSTNQYNTLVNYQLLTSEYNGIWTNAYANTLPDLKEVIALAEKEKAWNYWIIAKVMTAYNFHMLTDLYEDIPFTEALNPTLYPKPKYDNSKTVVYPGILKLLDEAIAKEADGLAASNPVITKQDFYFGGKIAKWVSFAKSLKLKIMMRDFTTYKAQIEALLAAGGLLEEDCAMTAFEDATNKGNPFYEFNIRQLNTTENVRACHTLCEYLINYNDPRIENIYEIKASASATATTYAQKYEGLPCGKKPETSGPTGIPLTNSSKFMQRYNDPVYLMNKAESYFLIAEAYARLDNKAKAKENYENGVRASFNRWAASTGKADAFLAGSYMFDQTSIETMLKSILTQKWVSFARANALDGAFDRMRTGIPALDPTRTVRVADHDRSQGLTPGYVLGTLVTPASTVLQANETPRRLLIPDASAQYNPNAPKTKAITEPMWWQVAKGI